MSLSQQGSAAAPKGAPESAENQTGRSAALLTSMTKSRAVAQALLLELDASPGSAAGLAEAAGLAHLVIAELWTLAEADLSRRSR